MKNITLKIILSLICCSLVVSLILSGTAIANSEKVMREEVRKELVYASQKYANEFSAELQTQENTVDLICTMVSATFDTESYRGDRQRFLSLEEKLNEIIKNTTKDTPEIKSLYLTFNPETSGGNDEVWYIKNENGETYYMEADNTIADWLVEGNADNDYYFEAIRQGKHWSGVEYDVYLDTYSVTYASGCWDKGGQLIGVVGADIFIDDILDTVKNIELNEGGYAFLMDDGHLYLAGSQEEAFFKEMKGQGVIKLAGGRDIDKGGPPVSYATMNGERYLTTYAFTSNGWVLVLVQSEDSMLLPMKHMTQTLIAMAVLIVAAVVAYAIYFSRNAVAPIIKEYEMKDLMLLNQSRQARLGEMVGNIAHQWKQPLNVISITLSNLWDDFQGESFSESQLKDHIQNMRNQIRSMSSTVDDFATFLKPGRKKERFSVNKEIQSALTLMNESIKINNISVIIDSEEEFFSRGFKNEFCQGIFNILDNARDAIIESDPEKREIQIRLYKGAAEKQKVGMVIDISNQGNQIPKESEQFLFTPYYSTKEAAGGTGIGLYLTKQIVEVHMDGTIELFNTAEGVCCRMWIPMEADQ